MDDDGLPDIVEESTNGAGAGDDDDGKVYVAVGKSIEKAVSLLKWSFGNFKGKEICLLHVHQPSPLIPTLLGRLPASQANDLVVAAYRKEEREQTNKLMETYLRICSASKVKASMVTIDAGQVQKGIVELINKNCIGKLVMGALPKNSMKVKKSSSKARYVAENSPLSCQMWLIYKGKHVWTKEASTGLIISQLFRNIEARKISKCKSLQHGTNKSSVHQEGLRSNSAVGITSARVNNWVIDEEVHMELENIQSRIKDGNIEAEDSENEAFMKVLKCRKMELEANEVIKKVKLFESGLEHEVKLRVKAEESLRSTIQMKEKLVKEKKDVTRKLQKAMRNVADLESRAQDTNHRRDEAADKLNLIQELIFSLRQEKQKIQMQNVEAVRWLDRWKNGRQLGTAYCNGFVEKLTELAEFTLADLETATCDFSQSFKLGQGGFGCVYKGEMLGRTVAIKKLYTENMQRQSEFQREVHVLGRLQHPHLVTLLGVCPDAWSLIYEYLPNGSLKDNLFPKNKISPLPWKIRVRMILEISSALCFLHSSKPEKIVHGNLKPENILLDAELHCKICEFGICRLITENTSFRPCFCQQTGPYADPEFNRIGLLTPKSDIYSFGVIILQLVTGRPPIGLVSGVCKAVLSRNLLPVLDSTAGEWPVSVATRLVEFGLQCCKSNGKDRPDLTPTLVRELEQLHISEERSVPSYFLCPILQEIMNDPQVAADGFTYEGEALRGWLANGRETSPMTNLKLDHLHLTPNHALRLTIQDWLCKH